MTSVNAPAPENTELIVRTALLPALAASSSRMRSCDRLHLAALAGNGCMPTRWQTRSC